MKIKILFGIIGVLGAAVGILPLSVYHFIEMAGRSDHTAMACHTANQTATVIGIGIAAIVIIGPFILKKTHVFISALLGAGGIAVLAVPQTFDVCPSVDMACRYLTMPSLTMLGSLIIILSIILIAAQAIAMSRSLLHEQR